MVISKLCLLLPIFLTILKIKSSQSVPLKTDDKKDGGGNDSEVLTVLEGLAEIVDTHNKLKNEFNVSSRSGSLDFLRNTSSKKDQTNVAISENSKKVENRQGKHFDKTKMKKSNLRFIEMILLVPGCSTECMRKRHNLNKLQNKDKKTNKTHQTKAKIKEKKEQISTNHQKKKQRYVEIIVEVPGCTEKCIEKVNKLLQKKRKRRFHKDKLTGNKDKLTGNKDKLTGNKDKLTGNKSH